MISNPPLMKPSILWHQRLGHAPLASIGKIEGLKGFEKSCTDVCLTCPAAKFTKLPYKHSESRARNIFDLVHIDIWGPYKVDVDIF